MERSGEMGQTEGEGAMLGDASQRLNLHPSPHLSDSKLSQNLNRLQDDLVNIKSLGET